MYHYDHTLRAAWPLFAFADLRRRSRSTRIQNVKGVMMLEKNHDRQREDPVSECCAPTQSASCLACIYIFTRSDYLLIRSRPEASPRIVDRSLTRTE